MNKDKQHDEHCRIIGIKPQLLDLENIAISTDNAHLFRQDTIFQEPDNLMFDFKTSTIYSIEYKCHDSHSQRRCAIAQLEKRYDFLKSNFTDWNIVNLYVHDNYKVERILRW